MNNNMIKLIKNFSKRTYSTKLSSKTNEDVLKSIENAEYKPKSHPGILKLKVVSLPDSFLEAVQNVTEDLPVKKIIADSVAMCRHLKGRVPPMEQGEILNIKTKTYERVLMKESKKVTEETANENLQFKQVVKDKVIRIMKQKIYNWSPMVYDGYRSLVYLYGRSAAEYAVLVKIFLEIHNKDKKFIPRSLFDFGSGIGTATWAANAYWNGKIYEYYNVDTSSFMNDLAQLLLQDGRGTKKMDLKGVFYRQFLPANNTLYDLVVSAYSLLELPSTQFRMDTILKLWNKTDKYLILVEQGTNAGFKVISEARDFILQLDNEYNKGYVFSPCPHENVCPRFLLQDNTPCNFETSYKTIPIGGKSENSKELYCYVVLKKGNRNPSDEQWPRVVRDTLIRSKHTICRMCTKHGDLQEIIFTASKHGKITYRCARSTKWGDQLPILIEKSE